jgi:hypothetical protein
MLSLVSLDNSIVFFLDMANTSWRREIDHVGEKKLGYGEKEKYGIAKTSDNNWEI